MKKITIVGAGIGGLTAAIALKQKGFEVELFEHTPEFKNAGSGINLASNAMQVYQKLGLHDAILSRAHHTRSMNLRSKNMDYLAQVNLEKLETEFGVKGVAIHRATLHQILLDHLEDTPIHLNKKLKCLQQSDSGVRLEFADGSIHNAGTVIGADGIHSAVRKSVLGDSPLRDARQLCWRGISTAPIDKYDGELNEIWGQGNRFGFVRIARDKIYWYALVNKSRYADPKINLTQVFADYHPTVLALLKDTPQEHIICSEIWDLKPIKKWHKQHVCLLGDAAHATTPNMGQGACQAIESALALSICLQEENNTELAFGRYEKMRMEKAHHVVHSSWRVGKMAHWNNPISASLRNLALKITPESVMEKSNRKIFELNY